jgi:hypothetical protein
MRRDFLQGRGTWRRKRMSGLSTDVAPIAPANLAFLAYEHISLMNTIDKIKDEWSMLVAYKRC